jgi:hypothetical protein
MAGNNAPRLFALAKCLLTFNPPHRSGAMVCLRMDVSQKLFIFLKFFISTQQEI